MSKERISYYVVKRGRAFWQPTKAMRSAGFECVACGLDGPAARATAEQWNARWQEAKRSNEALQPAAGYVYFLRSAGRVKIGFSKNPFTRSSEIRTSLAAPIDCLVAVPGTRADEAVLHQRLAAYRQQGEWFVSSTPVIRAMLAAISGLNQERKVGAVVGQELERQTEG